MADDAIGEHTHLKLGAAVTALVLFLGLQATQLHANYSTRELVAEGDIQTAKALAELKSDQRVIATRQEAIRDTLVEMKSAVEGAVDRREMETYVLDVLLRGRYATRTEIEGLIETVAPYVSDKPKIETRLSTLETRLSAVQEEMKELRAK